jgi:hypothetical protein
MEIYFSIIAVVLAGSFTAMVLIFAITLALDLIERIRRW